MDRSWSCRGRWWEDGRVETRPYEEADLRCAVAVLSPPMRSRVLLFALHGAAFGVFALRNLGREAYDDAYFFKRFALHALDAGKLAWNLDEGAVHGSTSQLWQAVVVAITAVAPQHVVLGGRCVALLSLLLAAYLLIRTSAEHDGGVCATLALTSPACAYALLSGMESALLLALLAGCALLGASERGARARWIEPSAVLLVYLTRPDAVVLALALLFAGVRARRELYVRGALCAAALGAWLGIAKLYYGTALPLPFYAKTAGFSPYDAEFLAQCARSKLQHLALFALAALPLASVACLRLDRRNGFLLAGTAVFAGYHALLGVDVMGMHARFYLPALVPLALAGARGLSAGERRAGAVAATWLAALLACAALWLWSPEGRAERIAVPLLAAHVLAVLGLLACSTWPRVRARAAGLAASAAPIAAIALPGAPALARLDDDAYLHAHIARGTVFRGLPKLVACLGDRIHVYHSEAGVPGLLIAHGKVSDLAGLLSPAWLFRRADFDSFCLRERPHAIFLPHRNYRALNREIAGSRCLREYVRVTAGSASPLYLRADLAHRYARCPDPAPSALSL
jgi:hypothetical protein